jgi:hypothetical protein
MRALGFAALPIAAAVLLVACSGDLFHSTDWPNLCTADPGSCGGAPSGSATIATTATTGAGGGGAGPTGASTGASTTSSSAASSGAGGAPPACNAGELQNPDNLHCYAFVAAPTDWSSARAACLAQSGDLASITSAVENAFVAANITATSWLGGTDAASEGTWLWSNGDAFSYTNWNAGEPNNSGGIENCNTIYGAATGLLGLWNDADCTTMYPYVCERAP